MEAKKVSISEIPGNDRWDVVVVYLIEDKVEILFHHGNVAFD